MVGVDVPNASPAPVPDANTAEEVPPTSVDDAPAAVPVKCGARRRREPEALKQMMKTSPYNLCRLLEQAGGQMNFKTLKQRCIRDRKRTYPKSCQHELPKIVDREVNKIINVLLGMEIVTLRVRSKPETVDLTKAGNPNEVVNMVDTDVVQEKSEIAALDEKSSSSTSTGVVASADTGVVASADGTTENGVEKVSKVEHVDSSHTSDVSTIKEPMEKSEDNKTENESSSPADEELTVHWEGFPPSGNNSVEFLEESKRNLLHCLRTKKEHLQELLLQQIAFKQLIRRNKEEEEANEWQKKVWQKALEMRNNQKKKDENIIDASNDSMMIDDTVDKDENKIEDIGNNVEASVTTEKYSETSEKSTVGSVVQKEKAEIESRLYSEAEAICLKDEARVLAGETSLLDNLKFDEKNNRIPLPFIIVNTNAKTRIQIEMSETGHSAEEVIELNKKRRRGQRAFVEDAAGKDIFFNFSHPFEIHDDNEILKRLNYHQSTPKDLPGLIPPELIPFLPEIKSPEEDELKQLVENAKNTRDIYEQRVALGTPATLERVA